MNLGGKDLLLRGLSGILLEEEEREGIASTAMNTMQGAYL